MDAFAKAIEQIKVPICYNGEINSVEDAVRIKEQFPQIDRIMIGRGVLRYPHLMQQIKLFECNSGMTEQNKGNSGVDCNITREMNEVELKNRIRTFHDELLEEYRIIMSGDRNALFKMKEIWTYMGESFEGADKCLKKIKKANHISDYKIAVNELFFLNLRKF